MAAGIKVKYNFVGFEINMQMYRRSLLRALRKFNEKAGQAWISTAVDTTPIPTWSGASRATFQKLANELGTSVPIGPIKAPKDRTSLGRSTSSSGVWEEGNDYVGFTYETDLRYLAYNEYNKAIKGPPPQPFSNAVRFTPYKFQERAKQAWETEASKAKLPNPYKYITTKAL